MTEKAKNRSRLWQSLEMSVIKRDLSLYTITVVVASLISACQHTSLPAAVSWALFAVLLLPFWGFYLWRIFRIFHKAEKYDFCRSTLDRPHQFFFRRERMYFTVIIEEPDGSKYPTDTHAIFVSHGFIGPLVENYVNSTVTIGYNKETGMVVVIG